MQSNHITQFQDCNIPQHVPPLKYGHCWPNRPCAQCSLWLATSLAYRKQNRPGQGLLVNYAWDRQSWPAILSCYHMANYRQPVAWSALQRKRMKNWAKRRLLTPKTGNQNLFMGKCHVVTLSCGKTKEILLGHHVLSYALKVTPGADWGYGHYRENALSLILLWGPRPTIQASLKLYLVHPYTTY